MKLTPEAKAYIDSLTIHELLSKIRFAPVGDTWFQDETGKYWMERYTLVRSQDNAAAVTASKAFGW